MSKIFYKKRLVPEERGLLVVTDEYISIHETKCFYFCIHKNIYRISKTYNHSKEMLLQHCRRSKVLKRVAKSGSRFAFATEKEAFEHLKFLKQRQLSHIKRDAALIKAFLDCQHLEKYGPFQKVPNSNDLVREFYVFE